MERTALGEKLAIPAETKAAERAVKGCVIRVDGRFRGGAQNGVGIIH